MTKSILALCLLLPVEFIFFFPLISFASVKPNYFQSIGLSDSVPLGSQNVVVAIIDEGIDFAHPALQGSEWTNAKEVAGNGLDDDGNGYTDDVHGYNFISDYGDVSHGVFGAHGTFISSLIAGKSDERSLVQGVAPLTRLMSVTACTDASCDPEQVVKGVRYAMNNGAKVINLSLAGPDIDAAKAEAYQAVFKEAVKKGVIIVAAAGNGFVYTGIGKNLNVLGNQPICDDGGTDVIGVASVDRYGIKSSFSDFGSSCVNLVSPGEELVGAEPSYFNSSGILYSIGQGTSYSSGIVSGIFARLISIFPKASREDIVRAVLSTAHSVDGQNSGRYAGQLGSGEPNLGSAVAYLSAQAVQVPKKASPPKVLQIYPGQRGKSVVIVQDILSRDGCYKGTANGVYNTATIAAVRCFQKKHRIPSTGSVGPLTQKALQTYSDKI